MSTENMRAIRVPTVLLAIACFCLLAVATARAQDGALRVEAEAPATVLVDRTPAGPAPVEVRGLARGRHLVRIEFTGGGATQRFVDVSPGQTAQVHFAYPRKFAVAGARHGMHFMMGANSFYLYERDGAEGMGGHLELGFNLGLNPRIDLRSVVLVGGGRYGRMHGRREHGLEVALRPSIHFNHTDTVGTDFGVRVGLIETWYRRVNCEGWTSCPQHDLVHVSNLAVGMDVAPISLRLGERGAYELAARGAMLFVPRENQTAYVQLGLTFSYLLLGV